VSEAADVAIARASAGPAKRRTGRPPLFDLDPELQDKLINAISIGMYIERSFTLVGVRPKQYYRWKELADREREPYYTFWGKLEKAEAEGEFKAIQAMLKGGNSFVPHATLLERRFRDRWGRSDNVNVSGNITVKIEVVDFKRHYQRMLEARKEPKLVNPTVEIASENKAKTRTIVRKTISQSNQG
jgi:hypothetical protein